MEASGSARAVDGGGCSENADRKMQVEIVERAVTSLGSHDDREVSHRRVTVVGKQATASDACKVSAVA